MWAASLLPPSISSSYCWLATLLELVKPLVLTSGVTPEAAMYFTEYKLHVFMLDRALGVGLQNV